MNKIENYLGIANHDIQVANNSDELKSYVASILCEIDELQQENQELKYQLAGTTHCFDEEEHEKLKKEVEELKEEKQEWINLLAMFKNQQKEFIEYMTNTIEELECDDVDDEEMKGYLIQRIDTFKEILHKYKEIIGDDK